MPNKIKNERRAFIMNELRVDSAEKKSPVIVGHASVFDQLSEDLWGFREKILKGAFTETIKNDDIRALFNHDPNHVLGRNTSGTLRLKEDETGLLIEIDPPDTQLYRDLQVSMERGDINQMSFGFRTGEGDDEWSEVKDGEPVRSVKKVSLFDISLVTYPAYPQTDCAVRSLEAWKDSKKQTSEALSASLRRYQQAQELRFGRISPK